MLIQFCKSSKYFLIYMGGRRYWGDTQIKKRVEWLQRVFYFGLLEILFRRQPAGHHEKTQLKNKKDVVEKLE